MTDPSSEKFVPSFVEPQLRTISENIREVWKTDVFAQLDTDSPYFFPCLTYLLVQLHDGLQMCSAIGYRCTVTTDVAPWPKEEDLTSLIAAARAAACHITSDKRVFRADERLANLGWSVVRHGRAGSFTTGAILFNTGMTIGDSDDDDRPMIPSNPFPDDILFSSGRVVLYLNRNMAIAAQHIENVAMGKLGPLPQ